MRLERSSSEKVLINKPHSTTVMLLWEGWNYIETNLVKSQSH